MNSLIATIHIPNMNPLGWASILATILSLSISYIVPQMGRWLNSRGVEFLVPTSLFGLAIYQLVCYRFLDLQHHLAAAVYMGFGYGMAFGQLRRCKPESFVAAVALWFVSSTVLYLYILELVEMSVVGELNREQRVATIAKFVVGWAVLTSLALMLRKKQFQNQASSRENGAEQRVQSEIHE